MRPAPGEIPNTLPPVDKIIKNITYLMDVRRPRLKDYSISDLVQQFSDGSPKWLTGSTVWLPSVFDKVDETTDLDIVFSSKESCERFIVGALAALPGYTRGNTTWGSGRIIHADGNHVIDAWSLEGDESIEELLLTYPSDYQRCAYFMTWSGASPGYLTRIIKKRTKIRQTTGGYRRQTGVIGRAIAAVAPPVGWTNGPPVQNLPPPRPPHNVVRNITLQGITEIQEVPIVTNNRVTGPITITLAGGNTQPQQPLLPWTFDPLDIEEP